MLHFLIIYIKIFNPTNAVFVYILLKIFRILTVIYIVMNLHEECLLKYLINPMQLFNSTERLILTNKLIEQKSKKSDVVSNNIGIHCVNM